MIRSFETLRGFVVALAFFGWSNGVLAQPQPTITDPKEMARRLGEEALALQAEGRFAEAYSKFEMAEKIAHSPVFVLWLARSKRSLGELLAAKRLYQKLASESLASDASPNWLQAKAEAEKELAALLVRIPTIAVTVVPSAEAAKIELDGAQISADTTIELDPGEHVVRVLQSGRVVAERRVRVEEGQAREAIRVALTPMTKPPTEPDEGTDGSLLPGGILLGVGLLGAATGAVFGAYSLVLAGEVEEGCVGNRCLLSDAGKAEDADTLARASTGAIIAGSIIGATGIVLMIVRPGGDAPATTVRLKPGWLGVEGRF